MMNATQIKTMNANECFKKIAFIEANARHTGKEITQANKKLIKQLEARIDALNPDRED